MKLLRMTVVTVVIPMIITENCSTFFNLLSVICVQYVCWLQLKLVVDKGHAVENVYMGKSSAEW